MQVIHFFFFYYASSTENYFTNLCSVLWFCVLEISQFLRPQEHFVFACHVARCVSRVIYKCDFDDSSSLGCVVRIQFGAVARMGV